MPGERDFVWTTEESEWLTSRYETGPKDAFKDLQKVADLLHAKFPLAKVEFTKDRVSSKLAGLKGEKFKSWITAEFSKDSSPLTAARQVELENAYRALRNNDDSRGFMYPEKQKWKEIVQGFWLKSKGKLHPDNPLEEKKEKRALEAKGSDPGAKKSRPSGGGLGGGEGSELGGGEGGGLGGAGDGDGLSTRPGFEKGKPEPEMKPPMPSSRQPCAESLTPGMAMELPLSPPLPEPPSPPPPAPPPSPQPPVPAAAGESSLADAVADRLRGELERMCARKEPPWVDAGAQGPGGKEAEKVWWYETRYRFHEPSLLGADGERREFSPSAFPPLTGTKTGTKTTKVEDVEQWSTHAERLALRYMKFIGFDDAKTVGNSSDGGVDVCSSRALAQVKAYFSHELLPGEGKAGRKLDGFPETCTKYAHKHGLLGEDDKHWISSTRAAAATSVGSPRYCLWFAPFYAASCFTSQSSAYKRVAHFTFDFHGSVKPEPRCAVANELLEHCLADLKQAKLTSEVSKFFEKHKDLASIWCPKRFANTTMSELKVFKTTSGHTVEYLQNLAKSQLGLPPLQLAMLQSALMKEED